MGLNEKVFPLRMSTVLYFRLQHHAQMSCMTVTAYLRTAFIEKLERDEAAERQLNMLAVPEKKRRR